MNIIQVCKTKCDNDLYSHLSNGKALYFCCKKGFEQSLIDFTESLKGESFVDEFGNLKKKKK